MKYLLLKERWQSLAECNGFENRQSRNTLVGSNPTRSAKYRVISNTKYFGLSRFELSYLNLLIIFLINSNLSSFKCP